jgi:Trk-type K+ transport system membrane component
MSPTPTVENNTLPLRQFIRHNSLDPVLNKHLQSLPSAQHLRVKSHIILIVVILSTCFTIYLSSFLAIGFWLKYYYNPEDLSQSNTTINPFYASLVISITGFNQNGLSVW